jgi:hypothetical protein
MSPRLVLGGLVVAAACGKPPHDASERDGGMDLTDSAVDAAVIDTPDARDPVVPDLAPPLLDSVTPATGLAVWLHAPIRLAFNEPLDPQSVSLAVNANLGGAAVAAQLAFEPPSTVVITLPATARGVGALELDVTGSVTDLAGNAFAMPIDLDYVVQAWSAAPLDRGYAQSSPELAVAPDGTAYAAWLVGSLGARRAVAGALIGNAWHSLGGEIGTGDVGSVAITIDGGTPIVAWTDGGQAHVARWVGTWSEYTAPGAASFVALATPPAGAPLLALFGATASVHELTGMTWTSLGMDVEPPNPIARSTSLAAGVAGKPAIGWIDTQNQLRVYRYDASWTAIAPLAVSPGSHMSLAARGSSIAVAYDLYAGSYGVLAAQAVGVATTWTRLGRALDIDIAGNATGPAIAYDASGAPVVAWTELVETAQRGGLARWSGSAWSIVGGRNWLDDVQAPPARARIALHMNEAAVVGTSAAGTVHVARFNGPRVAGPGLSTRASIAGCSFDAANPPPTLSQTGCFNLATPGRPAPHPGLIPFDIVSELWSDGAKKRRYIALPDNATMSLGANGAWVAPAGSMLIKQFDLETTPGEPSTRRVIETRFWVNDASLGWSGFSYRWNAAGTDASLLTDGVWNFTWPMDDGSQHTHQYPSRAHCRSCHHASMGPLLGVRSEQLARWFDYNGVIAEQLSTLQALGVAPVASATPFISPHEPGETWERRMRGYMAGNCAHCHNNDYLMIKDLRYTTPLSATRLCETITPGAPASSRVYQLVTSRPGMPALGTLMVDPLADQMSSAWIAGMSSCP